MSIVPDRRKTDLEVICEANSQGKKVDPEVVKRVRERSEAVRRKYDHELSVELVRSAREE